MSMAGIPAAATAWILRFNCQTLIREVRHGAAEKRTSKGPKDARKGAIEQGSQRMRKASSLLGRLRMRRQGGS